MTLNIRFRENDGALVTSPRVGFPPVFDACPHPCHVPMPSTGIGSPAGRLIVGMARVVVSVAIRPLRDGRDSKRDSTPENHLGCIEIYQEFQCRPPRSTFGRLRLFSSTVRINFPVRRSVDAVTSASGLISDLNPVKMGMPKNAAFGLSRSMSHWPPAFLRKVSPTYLAMPS